MEEWPVSMKQLLEEERRILTRCRGWRWRGMVP
jgi:hypothetical protein